MTYRAIRSPSRILDFLLFRMKDEPLTHPPQSLEDRDKLSQTLVIASFHWMVLGLVVGRTS